MSLRPYGILLSLIAGLTLSGTIAAVAQEGLVAEPAWFTSFSHFPNQTGSYSVPVEEARYYSVLVTGVMLLDEEHRGNYFRATRCDACYCWQEGDRPLPGNNDPTTVRPWSSSPAPMFGMVSNNRGVDMCLQTSYNEQHMYWSGWFLSGSGEPLVLNHNLAAHPRNSTSLSFFVGRAPRNVNPNGVWVFQNNAWVDLRTAPSPPPGAAGSSNLFSSGYGSTGNSDAPLGRSGGGGMVQPFDEYLESTGQPSTNPPAMAGEDVQPGLRSRDACVREICPMCSQSIGLVGQETDARCQQCLTTQRGRIEACMNGGGASSPPPSPPSRCVSIIGTWQWFTGSTVLVDERLFRSSKGNIGEWTCKDPEGVIEIRWRDGGWIDTLRLSQDGRRLDGTNQHGGRVWGAR